MSNKGISLLFLWITVAFFHFGKGNYVEILWGQCYTHCLSRKEVRQNVTVREIGSSSRFVPSGGLIQACKKHSVCKWCLYACDRPLADYENHEDCLNDCIHQGKRQSNQGNKACVDSCAVISLLLQKKYGSCPSQSTPMTSTKNCTDECDVDLQCPSVKKCCIGECAATCLRPLEYKAIPQMPQNMTFKETRGGELLIDWISSAHSFITMPVLYMLGWWCPYKLTAEFKFTTKTQVRLKGYPVVQPGVRCNYMLAAINIHGSEGFTLPQKYTKKMLKPSEPQNLTHASSRDHGQRVDMTIKWLPPVHTDGMDVANYKICWSGGFPRGGSDVHQGSVKGDRRSYTIKQLLPCTMYIVQVQAVVKWKNTVTPGHPASINIEACPGPQPAGKESIPPAEPERTCHVYNIAVQEAHFVGTELKANVTWSLFPGSNVRYYKIFWKLDVCEKESQHRKTRDRIQYENTSKVKSFTLYNLTSDCVYEVKVHGVNFHGHMDEGHKAVFRTPPCLASTGAIVNVTCPQEVSPPLPPLNPRVSHTKMSCMCQVVIQWDATIDPHHTVRHYLVEWGQSRPPGSHGGPVTIIFNSRPFKLKSPKGDMRACLTFLERSKHYTVRIISKTSTAQSEPAIYHFETPQHMSPCYGSSNQQNEDEDDKETENSLASDISNEELIALESKALCLHVSVTSLGLLILANHLFY